MQTTNYTPYEYNRIVSHTNGVNNFKEFQLRDIKHRITRDFFKSIDAENVLINGVSQNILITRDKGDEQIKRIKSLPDERFELGDYVNWNGTNYIIYKIDADRRIQSKGRMYECNMTLRWKNSKGEIIERVGKAEDATKYGEGTEGTEVIRIGKFQIKVLVRLDEETVKIRRDDRFIVDAMNYIDIMVEDGILPDVYKVTRINTTTGTFPDVGYIEITMIEDRFVPGHDDYENMIACKVSEMIKEGSTGHESDENNSGDDNSNDENNNDQTNAEEDGGWL